MRAQTNRRRRRYTVAFERVEAVEQRVFRQAMTGLSVDDVLTEPRRVGLGYYWCAACFTENDYDIPARRIYTGTKVPEDARCEDCSIDISDLQATMSQDLP